MNQDADELQDRLFRRIGELNANLCRYDRYLRSIIAALAEQPRLELDARSWNINLRVALITRLFKNRGIPDFLKQQFASIHEEMRPVLGRQAIGVKNPAITAQIDMVDPLSTGTPIAARLEALRDSVAAVEGDVLSAVKLYLQLATLNKRIERFLARDAAGTSLSAFRTIDGR